MGREEVEEEEVVQKEEEVGSGMGSGRGCGKRGISNDYSPFLDLLYCSRKSHYHA